MIPPANHRASNQKPVAETIFTQTMAAAKTTVAVTRRNNDAMSKLLTWRLISCVPIQVKTYASRVRKSAVGGAKNGNVAIVKGIAMQHISKPRDRGGAQRKHGTAKNNP